jgi:hypothetical protein
MEQLEEKIIDQDTNKQYILFKSIKTLDKANFYEYLSVMIDG